MLPPQSGTPGRSGRPPSSPGCPRCTWRDSPACQLGETEAWGTWKDPSLPGTLPEQVLHHVAVPGDAVVWEVAGSEKQDGTEALTMVPWPEWRVAQPAPIVPFRKPSWLREETQESHPRHPAPRYPHGRGPRCRAPLRSDPHSPLAACPPCPAPAGCQPPWQNSRCAAAPLWAAG